MMSPLTTPTAAAIASSQREMMEHRTPIRHNNYISQSEADHNYSISTNEPDTPSSQSQDASPTGCDIINVSNRKRTNKGNVCSLGLFKIKDYKRIPRPGPELDLDQGRTRARPGPEPDQGLTWTRAGPGPELDLDQGRTKARPGPGPGPHILITGIMKLDALTDTNKPTWPTVIVFVL
ncbi:hypothetical protein D5F01_LYC24327 [Larimichthys crocea]|uniref:Uncharacterized protein n=1 Tax=Larimichthys crocea TaxID=215358 RepID=A0A6G0HF68_LARCR|nr:hypothetical protein D5F01_LYC24327 [Larimichthys crocea]